MDEIRERDALETSPASGSGAGDGGDLDTDPLSGLGRFAPKPSEGGAAKAKPAPVTDQSQGDIGVDYTIVDLLGEVLEKKASDLHLAAGASPHIRIDGDLQPLPLPRLDPPEIKGLVYSMMSMKQISDFEQTMEYDFAYSIKKLGRFRVNVFKQRGSVGCVVRSVPTMKLSIEELGLPAKTKDLVMLPRGIIFVTGPTGSGKTTSLAAMIDYINSNPNSRSHIMTVEDPIEFLHKHKYCLVNQRELGHDTQAFSKALRHVLRQDPDVILVGELRDIESMQTAITAAETGHLVLTTLHTNDAAQTVDRIIDVFPEAQQNQIKLQLANSLQAIFCQTLCKRIGGGRVMAYELLIANNAVRNLIREGRTHQLKNTMEISQDIGMRTMNMSLIELVRKNVVTREEAREHSTVPTELDKELQGG